MQWQLKCFLLGGGDGEMCQWRRRLFPYEEELARVCDEFLVNIVLQPNLSDRWLWYLHPSKNYTFTSAYKYMMSANTNQATDSTAYAWNKEVSLKVSLFAWRLLRNLPSTTDNLIRSHVLYYNAQPCVFGCGKMEDVDHLLLSFDYFGKIWNGILQWLDFCAEQLKQAVNHLQQFESVGGFHKSIRLVFNIILLSCLGTFGTNEMLGCLDKMGPRYNNF